MQYTESEIVREYNHAKYKNHKIGILAQLNCVKRWEIIEILERNGVEVPKNYKDSTEEEYKPLPEYNKPGRPKGSVNKTPKRDKQPLEKPVEVEEIPQNRLIESEKSDSITKQSETIKKVNNQSDKRYTETPKRENDMISEATYHLVQMSLARIERRITRIERKQKKLKRLYKQLARFILG